MMRYIPHKGKAFLPLFTGLCLLLCFLTGCKETPPPSKPAVVSKRIEQVPEKTVPEKKTSPSLKETMPASVPAVNPDTKNADSTEVEKTKAKKKSALVKIDSPEAEETAQQEVGEQPSLRSSLPDTSPLYNPAGKIDPFTPLFSEDRGSTDSKETEPKRPLTPLEQIDLSQLQLVAILQTRGGNKAMVEDATGKGYILIPGTYIGVNSGKVSKILKDSVIVEEDKKDFLGKVTTTTRELKLQKPFGEE